MQQIIECVPNFSEGRRPEVIDQIVSAIRSISSVRVLDISTDADHNRTVVTFVGDLTAVEEAAFLAIKTAAQLIDLELHQGEHPRLGATDVVPFIPVRNASMADCVALAQRLGQRVGDELGIAVYLYAEAATRPERKKLGNIRKGEYERWREEVSESSERTPDFGPAVPAKWGATVIGARPFLIAYNIFLNTDDVAVANKIARSVRTSSGGLQNVQGLGFLVDGQAQVSMNLLNFEQTPIHLVQEMVRREASRYGLLISSAELIGLAPQQALLDAARYYLQLDGMQDDQLLEHRLTATTASEDDLVNRLPEPFLDALAGASATPGGGSAAALAGALAAALAEMVAGLTTGRKKYADVADEATAVLGEAGRLRRQLTAAIVEDADAFTAVMAAYRDKDREPEERAAAIEEATVGAGTVPLQVVRLSRDAARLAETIARIGNTNAATDAAAGAVLARAAAEIAAMNVQVNAVSLKDQALAAKWNNELQDLLGETKSVVDRAIRTARKRGGY